VEPGHQIPVQRQCELLGLSKAAYYYQAVPQSDENLQLMRMIDERFLEDPTVGVERMTAMLRRAGKEVNPKRVRRLMRLMGLMAVYPKPRLTLGYPGHRKHPNRLADVDVERPDQVWASDITYVPLRKGFGYVVAILDLWSRFVVAWEFSLSLDVEFCLRALERALQKGTPEIFHTDQGVQYTCDAFQTAMPSEVMISMCGKSRV
jgi:putative transposase